MLCESNTSYLSNFIIYTGATTNYTTPLVNLTMPFDNYNSLSKVVLSLMNDFIQCGYCLTFDNYYASPEINGTLLSLETDCNGTLKKKQNLSHGSGNGKPKKAHPPAREFKGHIMNL